MKVKICGVTRAEDAEAAVAAGADYVGLNFWPSSRRHVDAERAARIAGAVRGRIQLVGVFVDAPAADILATAAAVGLDVVQLHGSEGPDVAHNVRRAARVWRAFPGSPEVLSLLRPWRSVDLEAILLDTPSVRHGGTGLTFDWDLAATVAIAAAPWPLVLAGGLTPANVAEAVRRVQPWAIDVASGVESAPGVKDAAAIAALVAAARSRVS